MSGFKFSKQKGVKVNGEDTYTGRLLDYSNHVLVVTNNGHLISVPDIAPMLKPGQRLATEADVKKSIAAAQGPLHEEPKSVAKGAA